MKASASLLRPPAPLRLVLRSARFEKRTAFDCLKQKPGLRFSGMRNLIANHRSRGEQPDGLLVRIDNHCVSKLFPAKFFYFFRHNPLKSPDSEK
jgi:hypothetical protein